MAIVFDAEMAKETKANPDGVIVTDSGKVAAMGSAVDHITLLDFPSLGIEKLKQMRDFGYVHNDTYHFRMLSAFAWRSETEMELTATNGEVLSIDSSSLLLTLRKPDGQQFTMDPEDSRRLNMFGGALLTSGSFTMMSSNGY